MKIIKWLFLLLFLIGVKFSITGIWLIVDEYPNIKPASMLVTDIDNYTTSNGARTTFYGHLSSKPNIKTRLRFSKTMRKAYSNLNSNLNEYFILNQKEIPIWSDHKRTLVRFRLEKNSVKPKMIMLYWGNFFVAIICMLPFLVMMFLKRGKFK